MRNIFSKFVQKLGIGAEECIYEPTSQQLWAAKE